MTRQKHLKERVRARMLKTGESYTAARRRVVAGRPETETLAGGYALRGGTHPDTAALSNTLANAGCHIGRETSNRELILGIGGGLGFLHPVAFKGRPPLSPLDSPNGSTRRWLVKTCLRLGSSPMFRDLGPTSRRCGPSRALSSPGRATGLEIDVQEIGYWHFPSVLGMGGYPFVVIEERAAFLIDDRNSATISVDEATLRADSRARAVRTGTGFNTGTSADISSNVVSGDRAWLEDLGSPSRVRPPTRSRLLHGGSGLGWLPIRT